MPSSVQSKLLQSLEVHLLSYLDDLRYIHTQSYTSTKQKIQELIMTTFHKYGITTQYLDPQHTIIYGDLITGAPYTLLLYIPCTDTAQGNQWMIPLIASL